MCVTRFKGNGVRSIILYRNTEIVFRFLLSKPKIVRARNNSRTARIGFNGNSRLDTITCADESLYTYSMIARQLMTAQRWLDDCRAAAVRGKPAAPAKPIQLRYYGPSVRACIWCALIRVFLCAC